MRFSIRLNNDVPVERYLTVVETAERYGFDQAWVSNDLLLRSAPVLVAAAATRTERISLGIGIMNPYSVHPAELAMIAATLQELSHGRFLLGLAAGAEEFLNWAGIERDRPLGRMRQATIAVRALLGGRRPADLADAGPDWSEQAYLRIPPQSVPVYVGAMGPRMLELAGELGDGALPLLFPPEHLSVAFPRIRTAALDAGRDTAELDLAACFWCSVDPDRERARRALAEKIAYYGPSFSPFVLEHSGLSPSDFDPIRDALKAGDLAVATQAVTERMLSLGVAGDVEEIIDRCQHLIGAGADHISFGPPLGPDLEGAVRLLGEQVLPRLRRS